ncbi:MAG: hypothetical protein RMK29_01620 [Myxococcales bacterium]|nr:hypothetical protein [Myxococcota bacterium]MDW8280378.1 hypothetical protein [Myxococcales bacterium]
MRTPLLWALALVQAGLAAEVSAAPPVPIGPTEGGEEVIPEQDAGRDPPAAPPQAPPAAGTAVSPPQAAPQPMYFPGPVFVIPAWPGAATPTQPPARVAPARSPLRPRPVLHRLGLGARATSMWVNQRLYGADLLMMGGGAQARLRLGHRFGLEASFDVVGRNIHEGVFERLSYPVQLAALLHLLPPRPGPFFSVYAAAGGGVVPTRISLNDRTYPPQELTATEVMGQLGVGCELQLGRLSLSADARAVGLMRLGDPDYYDSFIKPDSGPRSLGLRQPPVLERSLGWTFSIGAMFWL